MTTGIGPYETPAAVNFAGGGIFEARFTIALASLDIGGTTVEAEAINGSIPAPTIHLNKDDILVVRLINNLPHPSGLHWHGIEMANAADGTPFTQNEIPPGGTYLYKLKVTRPGIFWYHPHHHHSTNRVFRGTYGMIVVADPNEATLIGSGVLPAAAQTQEVVLSDITVCKTPGALGTAGANDTVTYDPTLPFLAVSTAQPGPAPADLCSIAPLNEDGSPAATPFAAGEIPNIQLSGPGRTNEGQTVLTNGYIAGGRSGDPFTPGSLDIDALSLNVQPQQGIRLQLLNAATTRYFRLILTTATGTQIDLVRVGGEGGLLDNAVVEGGVSGAYDTKYSSGEILLPPASRADVVAVIPATATGVLTLWTQDFQRTGSGYSVIPTLPVMHFNVSGTAAGFGGISAGTPLRASIPGAAIEILPAATDNLLNPASFSPPKLGMANSDIELSNAGGTLSINGIGGTTAGPGPYTSKAKIASARYAQTGDLLQLSVTNSTGAHHPFHLHGFSIQPKSLTHPTQPDFTWPYQEFRDNVDVPAGYTLNFRVRIEDRELVDATTLGGALGRWLFHCHIFFHAHQGMISELVVTDSDGSEKPNVDVGGSWSYAPLGGIATRQGTFSHPDGDSVTLSASKGGFVSIGTNTWQWQYISDGSDTQTDYVYITAQDSSGRRDQTVFRLKIGGADDGSDNGDPHIHTLDGKRYDFQAAGEFVLLRDDEGMEIQTRQMPVTTANPITDSYSGLKSSVSVNTAVAATIGAHRFSYQPSAGEFRGQLQFYLDGKPTRIPENGIEIDGNRISSFAVGQAQGLRIDYKHHPVLLITPYHWGSHDIWILNISVSHTQADRGLMGPIGKHSWLPALQNGAHVGPMPKSLHQRHIQLYNTFADSWRVTEESSLFSYADGTSTATFTDKDWPAEEPPTELKPEFQIPGVPILAGMAIADAEQVCNLVKAPLKSDCVFDVATTGDEIFAKGYELTQSINSRATSIQVYATNECESGIAAVVIPLFNGNPTPSGSVSFYIDNKPAGAPVPLDSKGRACLPLNAVETGSHEFRAIYHGTDTPHSYGASSSTPFSHSLNPTQKKPNASSAFNWCRNLLILFIILLLISLVLD